MSAESHYQHKHNTSVTEKSDITDRLPVVFQTVTCNKSTRLSYRRGTTCRATCTLANSCHVSQGTAVRVFKQQQRPSRSFNLTGHTISYWCSIATTGMPLSCTINEIVSLFSKIWTGHMTLNTFEYSFVSISTHNLKCPALPIAKTTPGQFFKISPVHDWRSTLHNWRACQLQTHVTQKLGQISNIRPHQNLGIVP